MPTLHAINNMLKTFLNIVDENNISQAEAMIEGMNIQFEHLSVVNLMNEPIIDRRNFKQLIIRFRELESNLSRDTETMKLRFNVNNIDRNITI